MPKKNKKKRNHKLLLAIGAFFVLVIALALVAAFFDLVYSFVMENPWIFLIIPAVAIVALIIHNEKQNSLKAKQEQQIQQMLTHRENERRTQEEYRVQAILAHRADWGDEMCQWMIANRINPHKPATINVMKRYSEWGRDNCQRLLQQKIEIGMSADMVTTTLGNPSMIDDKETTAHDEKYRYVYGRPRRDATYIWFKNGVVTKIKQ